jgi:Phage integrase family
METSASFEARSAPSSYPTHGLATEMLRQGASLSEIGDLLGHRSPETTKIYTKVALFDGHVPVGFGVGTSDNIAGAESLC